MKKCSKCGIEKEDTDFWVRKNRASGLNSECKSCASERRRNGDKTKANEQQRKWREKNPGYANKASTEWAKNNKEKVNKAHRNYYLENRDKILEKRKEKYESTKENKRKYNKKEEVKKRLRVNSRLNYAVQTGKIIKPKICQICLEEKDIESHHPNYENALDVIWVCRWCHAAIHRVIKERKKGE